MAIAETKRAVERRLKAMTVDLPTAYEGVSFVPPAGMYQRIQFRVNAPDDPVFGKGYYRERIEAQVFIVDNAGTGTGGVLTRAELVRDHFKKGTTLTEGGLLIHVLETPQINSTSISDSKVVAAVLIDLVVEVITE